jgi:hypothetical protein
MATLYVGRSVPYEKHCGVLSFTLLNSFALEFTINVDFYSRIALEMCRIVAAIGRPLVSLLTLRGYMQCFVAVVAA